MNLTIPIRADNSTSSLSRDLGGNSSSMYVAKNQKVRQKRVVLLLVATMAVVGICATGGVGGVTQPAAAVEANTPLQNSQSPQSDTPVTTSPADQPSAVDDSEVAVPVESKPVPTTPEVVTTPAVTSQENPATQAPLPAVAIPSATTAITPTTSTSAAPQVVRTTIDPVSQSSSSPVQAVTLQPNQPSVTEGARFVDTAPAIAAMTQAQARPDSQPVRYVSGRMSDEVRDRLIIIAGVAAVAGAVLYIISFFTKVTSTPRRAVPIRYIFPVRGG